MANSTLFLRRINGTVVLDVGENTARAAAYAVRAELAAAIAMAASGPNYVDTAEGLLATSVGDTFAVMDGSYTVYVYRHDTGPIATLLRTFPTGKRILSGSVQANFDDMITAMSASRSGPLAAGSYQSEYEAGYTLEPGIYDAGGLIKASGAVRITARIPGSVVIRIPDGEYFLENSGAVVGTLFEGIIFLGGKGAYRSINAGANVFGKHIFRDCTFMDYTECAIQNEGDDYPYLEVDGCMFFGKATFRTMGIAWGGLLDGSRIVGNEFGQNAIHLKLGGGTSPISGRFSVRDNDFISFGGINTEADIWVVPVHSIGGSGVNAGLCGLFDHNKFGNENLIAGNPRVLFACEEAPGANPRGKIYPNLTWEPSTGGYNDILDGLIFTNNSISNISPNTAPFMRSYVGELREFVWSPTNKHDGGEYTWLCEFMGQKLLQYTNLNWSVTLNPTSVKHSSFKYGVTGRMVAGVPTYDCPVGPINDPQGVLGSHQDVLSPDAASLDQGYEVWMDARLPAGWLDASCSMAAFTDLYGSTTAGQELTFSADGGIHYISIPASTVARLAWVTILGLEKSATLALDNIRVTIYRYDGATLEQRDYVVPPNGQARSFSFPIISPNDNTANYVIALQALAPYYSAGVKTKVRFAGAYLNYGPRPAPFGHLRVPYGTWDGPHILTGSVHTWFTSAGQMRTKTSAPTSETDGAAVVTVDSSSAYLAAARLRFDYAASTPASGPGIIWGNTVASTQAGFYLQGGMNWQGDASNKTFSLRVPTTDGTLGAAGVALSPDSTSNISNGLDTSGGRLLTAASIAGRSGLSLPHGVAPSSPADGDAWTTTSGIFVRINGVTLGPLVDQAYADALIAAQDAMVFKGVIDCSANPNYPAADRGWTYRVSVAGKIGGGSGINVEAGDVLLCLTDGTASGTQAGVGASWSIIQTNLDGAVIGPASATNNGFAKFDGTTGKLLKDSVATVAVATEISGLGTGVAAALGVNIGSAGALVTFDGALGTPSSGTLTNCTFPTLNQSTTGSAATLTTPRSIYGNNFDGSAALSQVIGSAYGGTGNGFTKFSGPTTAERTFTLPDASATIATLGVAQTFTLAQTFSAETIHSAGAYFASTRLRFAYAGSSPASGPAVIWGNTVNGSQIGFYVGAGLGYQGDAGNKPFLVRVPTTDGTLGAIGIKLQPDVESEYSNGLRSSSLGYMSGSGGTVTQATDKSTAVTLNKATGAITLNGAALAADTAVSFTVNSTVFASVDAFTINHESAGTIGAYMVNMRATGAGTAEITIRNLTAGSLSEAIVLRYAQLRSTNS